MPIAACVSSVFLYGGHRNVHLLTSCPISCPRYFIQCPSINFQSHTPNGFDCSDMNVYTKCLSRRKRKRHHVRSRQPKRVWKAARVKAYHTIFLGQRLTLTGEAQLSLHLRLHNNVLSLNSCQMQCMSLQTRD